MPSFTYKNWLLIPALLLCSILAEAKGPAAAPAAPANFTSFPATATAASPAWLRMNAAYSSHPDAAYNGSADNKGMVELFEKRTERSKYFADPAKPGAFALEQSLQPMHYRRSGQWITIDPHLTPAGNGNYEAGRQPFPVGFDMARKASYITLPAGRIFFNNWQLQGIKQGQVTILASANWSQYTAGADGIQVKEIFPGIDAEMRVNRGEIKTSFIVHRNQFPGNDALRFRDRMAGSGNLGFIANTSKTTMAGDAAYNIGGKEMLRIQKGYAYAKNDIAAGVEELSYSLAGNELGMNIAASYLDGALRSGDVVIDPRVVVEQSLLSSTINAIGGKNCGGYSNFCPTPFTITPPAGATITRIYNKFTLGVASPVSNAKAFWRVFANGDSTCGYWVYLNDPTSFNGYGLLDSSGVGVGYGNVTSFFPCISKTTCPAAPVNFTIGLWDTVCSLGTGCSSTNVYAQSDFIFKIEGYTLMATPITRSSNVTICAGTPVTLSRTAAFGSNRITYSWSPNTGDTTASVTVSPAVTTKYTSTITDGCNTFIDTTTIFVAQAGTIPTFADPIKLCQFDPPVSLATLVTGTNLKWYANGTTTVFTTTAPVPPTNAPGVQNYYVSQTTVCGEGPRGHITVNVTPKPAPPTVASPLRLCQYDSVALTATGQSLRWYLHPTGGGGQYPFVPPTQSTGDSTYYYVTQTVSGCESDRARLLVTVTYKPNGIISPNRITVCQGEGDSFYYYGNARPDAVYNWTTPHPATVELGGQGTQGPFAVRFDSAGTYNVAVQVNNRGCLSEIATQPVTVRPSPAITFVAPSDACVDQIINIALSTISPRIDSFNYSFGDGTVRYSTATSGPFGVSYATAGQKVISSTAFSRGCPSRVSKDTINVHPLPDARFTVSVLSGGSVFCTGDSVLLTSAATDSFNHYVWTPDNFFQSGNVYTAKGFVNQSGYIKLQLTSQWGCVASDSVYIKTESCCQVFFPNAFTPNGDTRNDVFRPVSRGHHEVRTFRIVNRWGQVVYESQDEAKGWDGTYNGRAQEAGTYYYYFSYTCGDGGGDAVNRAQFSEKGEVLLLR